MIWIQRSCLALMTISILLCVPKGVIITSVLWEEYSKPLVDRKTVIFRVDASFSSEEQDAIGRALRRWEVATNGYITFKYYTEHVPLGEVFKWKSDGIPTIYDARSILSWPRHMGRHLAGTSAIGLATIYTGDIFLFMDDGMLESIATHEVGHILLDTWHSKDPQSIMYSSIARGSSPQILREEIYMIISDTTL